MGKKTRPPFFLRYTGRLSSKAMLAELNAPPKGWRHNLTGAVSIGWKEIRPGVLRTELCFLQSADVSTKILDNARNI